MRAYEIAVQFAAIEQELEDNGGELTPDLEARLNQLELEKPQKIDSIVGYIKNLELDYSALSTVLADIGERRTVIARKIDSLRTLLPLLVPEGDKYKGLLHQVSWAKNPPKVAILDEKKVPDAYLRFKDPEPDKKLILDDLKAGATIPGCEMAAESYSMRVK